MSTKTKNIKSNTEKLGELTQQIGLVLMTAAFTFGMVEIPEQSHPKGVVPSQPSFAYANNENGGFGGHGGGGGHDMRREREETSPHYVSYNNAQRTPGRTGKA